jgi:hypothetical protein
MDRAMTRGSNSSTPYNPLEFVEFTVGFEYHFSIRIHKQAV